MRKSICTMVWLGLLLAIGGCGEEAPTGDGGSGECSTEGEPCTERSDCCAPLFCNATAGTCTPG